MLHPQLITTSEIPRLLQEGEGQRSFGPLSEDRCLAALNRAYMLMSALGQQQEHPDLLQYVNADIQDNTTGLLDQPFPSRATALVALAHRNQADPTREEYNSRMIYRRNGFANAGGRNQQPPYEVIARQIFVRTPRYTNTYRLWFMKDVPSIHYGLVATPDFEGETTNTTIWMRTTPTHGYFDYRENIYKDQLVYIYGGSGAGQMAKIDTVTRVSASRYDATCKSINDNTDDPPFPIELDATSLYTLLPWFPPNYYYYLSMQAAVQFNMREGAVMLSPTMLEHKAKFEEYVTPYDPSAARPIIPNFASDLGLDSDVGGGYW